MELSITLDGRERTVFVDRRREGGYLIRVDDGPPQLVQAAALGGGDWEILRDGVRAVLGVHVSADDVAVQIGGRGLIGSAVDARTKALALGGGSGAGLVSTAMPGVVVRVLVKPGQAVAAGDAVIVVEAMKMENELKAPIGGTVEHVHVHPGQAVESGAALVTIADA